MSGHFHSSPKCAHADDRAQGVSQDAAAAYQAFDWIKQAQIDRHFSHIGDLKGTRPSGAVVDDRPKVERPGRCDAVLTEHSSYTDLYNNQQTPYSLPAIKRNGLM